MNDPLTTEVRRCIQASADDLYRLHADVATWHTWDPDTRWACLKAHAETL